MLGGLQCISGEDRQTGTIWGYCSRGNNGGAIGPYITLPPDPTNTDQRLEYVEDGTPGEEGAFLEGLYSGVQLLDLSERDRPVPDAQFWPLNGHGMPACHLPQGTLTLPWAQDMPPLDIRQGRRKRQSLLSCGALSQNRTNRQHVTTCGFQSRCGES